MNSLLVYTSYIIAIIFGAALAIKLWQTRKFESSDAIPAKEKFSVSQDQNYVKAVGLALKYNDMSIAFLRKRLDIKDKKEAEQLLVKLYETGIIAPPQKEEPVIKVK